MRISQKSKNTSRSPTTTTATDVDTIVPEAYDVLFGRGKTIFKHWGNARFHSILRTFKPSYMNAAKREKSTIVQAAIHAIQHGEGSSNKEARFLKMEEPAVYYDETQSPTWRLATKAEIFNKVQHVLRCKHSPFILSPALPPPTLSSSSMTWTPTATTTGFPNNKNGTCMVMLVPMSSSNPFASHTGGGGGGWTCPTWLWNYNNIPSMRMSTKTTTTTASPWMDILAQDIVGEVVPSSSSSKPLEPSESLLSLVDQRDDDENDKEPAKTDAPDLLWSSADNGDVDDVADWEGIFEDWRPATTDGKAGV